MALGAAILSAAQEMFSEVGYEHTTIRGVAQKAGVDAALVFHFFTSKYELFLAAMLPMYEGPSLLATALNDLDRRDFGARIAELFCYVMDNKQTNMMLLGMVRASVSEPKAALVMRMFVEKNLIYPIAQFLGVDDAGLKATLIGSHMVGLFMTRYIAKIEPLASATPSEIGALLGPVLQRYLN